MWYTCTGSSENLSAKEAALLHQLVVSLAQMGWKLRTAARGSVDDVAYNAAKLSGGVFKVFLQSPYYRDYDSKKEPQNLSPFDSFDFKIQKESLFIIGTEINSKITSTSERERLGVIPLVLLGKNLNAPSKFIITLKEHSRSFDSAREIELKYNKESPLLRLAKSKKIPVFDIGNDVHQARIESFISSLLNKKQEYNIYF